MRTDGGKMLAASAGFFVLVAACAPPPQTVTRTSPTPPPSPTPTSAMAAAAPTFHVGEVGVTYSPVALTATGGRAPYKWTVASGALPGGLTLGPDGGISGTPTAGGDFTFTIGVADSGDQSLTVNGKISIADALSAHLNSNCSSYCYVELGCVTACGSFGTLTGGVAPFAFSVVGGDVPSGTSVAGFALSGTFTGQTGWVQFTVQASDALGATSAISPKFWMYPHLSLSGGSVPVSPNNACFASGAPSSPGCTVSFPHAGGTPTGGTPTASFAWVRYSCPAAPPSPAITVSSSEVTVAIPAVRLADCNGYQGAITITLANQDVCAAGPTYCSAQATVTIQQLGT